MSYQKILPYGYNGTCFSLSDTFFELAIALLSFSFLTNYCREISKIRFMTYFLLNIVFIIKICEFGEF